MSSCVPRIPPQGEMLVLNIAAITGLLLSWMKGSDSFQRTASLCPASSAWLQLVVLVHSACCENQLAETLKRVWDTGFYGQIKLSLCVNAAESRDCFENSLCWCLQGRSDIGDLRVDGSAATFKGKRRPDLLDPVRVFAYCLFFSGVGAIYETTCSVTV